MRYSMMLSLVLFACRGKDDVDDSDDGFEEGVDNDNDGFFGDADCDDDAFEINPDADEVCDGVDNDCDGKIDADDEDLTDGTDYFADADKDGFGSNTDITVACSKPVGLLPTSGDCVDDDPDVHPKAEEVCNDGIDNNCDGEDAHCEVISGAVEVVLYGEGATDETGIDIAVGDFDGNGYNDMVLGAPGDDDGGTEAGAAYVVFGPVDDGEIELAKEAVKLTGVEAGAEAGQSAQPLGDLDGDGIVDLGVSSPLYSGERNSAGVVYVISGVDIAKSEPLDDAASLLLHGGQQYDYAGVGMCPAGDVNDDGNADAWIGGPGDDDVDTNSGAIYLIQGPITLGSASLEDQAAKVTGEGSSRLVGTMFDAGDYNGDGFSDLLIGDDVDDTVDVAGGAAYLLEGPISGTVPLTVADAKVLASAGSQALGTSVTTAGDVDGDGRDDLLLGAPGDNSGGVSAGKAFLLHGAKKLADLDGPVEKVAHAWFIGETSDDRAGVGLASEADFDGDGELDFLVGANGWGTAGQGAAYLVFGPVTGQVDLDLEGDAQARFVGNAIDDAIGGRLIFTGPVAKDFDEGILLATPYADRNGADAGGAFLALALDK